MLSFMADQGFWKLTLPEPLTPLPDPYSSELLLSHRPDYLSPVTWRVQGQEIFFRTLSSGRCLAVEEMDGSAGPADGFKLLSAILDAILRAEDQLLDVDLHLLRPDLIFRLGEDKEAGSYQILCLPFATHGNCGGESPLIPWLASTYNWPDDQVEIMREFFQNRDWNQLSAYLESRQEKRDLEKSNPLPPRPSIGQSLRSWIRELPALSFLSSGPDEIHEDTGELNPVSLPLRIAQLSQGLPGTPEEEEGLRAYILTDDFLVGRELSRTDLTIDSQAVSRRHARICLKDNHFFLEDLGSKNGTVLDGMKLARHRPQLLPDKCRISFAGHAFYFLAD